MNVESNVEWVKPKELIKKTVELIHKFLASTTGSKAVFFFSRKETLRQVYKWVNNCSAVGMVDADCTASKKRQIFDEFENINSVIRIVLGTKLLSNGLDCRSVQFICLVDCFINCIDYLQMVSRIREWGVIRILAVEGKKRNSK